MCTGKCSLFIAITLYPLVLLSIICNILLFFPGWSTQYVKEGHITDEVKYMGGFIGGGVLVLIPALYIHLTGEQGCCANRFGMFFSIIFAAVGAAGAVYSFIVAMLGFSNGPLCKTVNGIWETPLKEGNPEHLLKHMWDKCEEPKNVIQFNMGLFVTLMVASILQGILCASQVINGLIGCICGTCNKEFQQPASMCTGKCSLCIAVTLYPLALISIICNIVLLFPDGDLKYVQDKHITDEVYYMGGIVGGGLLVLLPALHIHLTGKQGCCGNRCGMFLSILFAAVGVAGALYCFIVAAVGLTNGPYCKVLLVWTRPFKDREDSYLGNSSIWNTCTEPENIVVFNIGLFSTLIVTSGLEMILCAVQMINGLIGCLCGTCMRKETEMI
ncbi:uncharacterized protein LOC119779152 [Cyprinodon tularosa]|uniref:uncharacterized protein LOC119779152 n=1 Tax=Cyprinodon tularosa TaxID=77115 RepID=UPI0018E290D2|nr:uncharacterized protein LOC119779152 [Cyprinodon tularosa]